MISVRKLAASMLMIACSMLVMVVTARAGYTVAESYVTLLLVGTPVLVACGALAEGIGPGTIRNRTKSSS